jgi:Cu/Ag efflux protein CusF
MTMKTTMILSIALWVTGATGVSAQQTIKKGSSISATATIQAIDATKRTITLRDDKGQEDTYAVGPEVKRFDELKVGDKVNMTYYESIVFQIRKPGEKPAEEAVGTAMTRSTGATPGGTLAVQDRMTVTVKAIDPAVPSVTVTTPDGRTVTRRVEDTKNIENLKVGDQIDITYTLALLASIEHAK